MTLKGLFTSEISALNWMRYAKAGLTKSVDYVMIDFLESRFDKKTDEVIENS